MNKETKSILLVDDDAVFRARLARAFRERGFAVGEASGGKEAAAYACDEQPCYAVLDLKLERESGLEVLFQLKEKNPEIKVVLLTGYGTIATAVEAVKRGAVNYLTKPVDADTVLSALGLSEKAPSQELPTPALAQVEWEHIQRVVKEHEGNISKASKALGLHRRSLQRKLYKNPPRLK